MTAAIACVGLSASATAAVMSAAATGVNATTIMSTAIVAAESGCGRLCQDLLPWLLHVLSL